MDNQPIGPDGIAALTALVLELYAHQMATKKLLDAHLVSDMDFRLEVSKARDQLNRLPPVADFRSHMNSARLVVLEQVLRDILQK